MIRHIVFFKFQEANGLTKAEICNQIKQRFDALPSKINLIKKLTCGVDFLHSERSFDLALEVDFQNVEDMNSYQTHPEHLAVVEFMKPYKTAAAAVDFNL